MGIKKTIDKKCAILLVRVSTQTQDYQPQIDDLHCLQLSFKNE